jgi:peptide/nickel transport system substrate-binding protein
MGTARGSSGINRRDFVRRGVGASAFLLAGSGLVAACGDSDDGGATTAGGAATSADATTSAGATTSGEATSAAATTEGAVTSGATTAAATGTPRAGGTINFSSSSNPRGFDPAKWWDDISWDGSLNVFDRLTRIDDTGALVPELLASPPEITNDGTLYTFKLRPGVMFHHGREMTADDIKFSLERVINPATASEGGPSYQAIPFVGIQDFMDEKAGEISGFKVVDDHTLTVELETPDSTFIYYTSLPFAAVVPRDVVEEVGDKFNMAPVGSGPFKAAEVDASAKVVLERFAEYWDAERAANVDRVEWTVGVEPQLALLRIENGELDLQAEPTDLSRLAELQGNEDLADQLFIADTNDLRYLTLNTKHEAMQDLRVRQAIAHAMDREKLLRTIKGMGVQATGIWPPGMPFHSTDLGYPYDPDRAKALLAEAGFADGFDVEIITLDYTPHKEIGQTAQADLTAIGIRPTLKQFPLDAFLSAVAKFPPVIASDEFFMPFPHGAYRADGLFTTKAIEAGCCNYFTYSDPALDELIASGHTAPDDEAMAEVYRQVDRIVTQDQALMVPLFYPKSVSMVSSRLKGFNISVSPVPVARYFARYWIEE